MATRKHPNGLYVLFFTEMWERFGFYLMITIFTLCLNEHLLLNKGDAFDLYGTYMGLVYLSPLIGGYLADRVLGYRNSVLAGAAILAIGYGLLAVATSQHAILLLLGKLGKMNMLYLSIFFLVVGNGLFKPNMSTMVSNLYPQGDERRDSAFSIFYMGVNVGALFSPFAASYMRRNYGWGAAFATAGAGMIVGLIIFAVFSRRFLAVADQRSSLSAVVQMPLPAEYDDPRDPPEVERQRTRALYIMCAIVMLFWIAFHQNGSTLTFWAKDNTDRTFLPWLLGDEENFSALNSLFVIILTPIMMRFFSFLRRQKIEPSTPTKILYGMLLTAAAFGVMVAASLSGGDSGRVSALWLITSYFVVTLAELCLSPMGLSMVAKLAPRRKTALFMGVWYLATAVGNKLSGSIGRFWEEWQHHQFFGLLVVLSLLGAIILLTQQQRLEAAMPPEGKNEKKPTGDHHSGAQPVQATG